MSQPDTTQGSTRHDLVQGTRFAWVAGVFTRDCGAAHRLARDIDAGQIYLNEYYAGGIPMPFRGSRHSEFGLERGFKALRSWAGLNHAAARIAQA